MKNLLKQTMPKSLFPRFIMILIIPIILSQSIIGIIFFEKYTHTIFGIISTRMVGEASAITCLLDMKCDKEYVNELAKNMNIKVAILNDLKLKKQGISKNHRQYVAMKKAMQKKGYQNYYIDTDNQNMDIYLPSKNCEDVYKVSFLRKILYIKIIKIVLYSSVIASVVCLLVSFIFLKNQIRPIRKLSKAMIAFGNGIELNYKPEGAQEIREAGTTFEKMKIKVNELVSKRVQILAGISHDLRTPLTKMKLQLSLMPKSKEIEWLMNDVNMMIHMTESFTKHAVDQNKEISVPKNMYSFIFDLSKDYIDEKFAIDIYGDKNIEAYVKFVSIRRALGNIISNAKKHSDHLYITISNVGEYVEIKFEDNGCGIDIKTSDKLFQPFYTNNNARTHCLDNGVGLGLSIAYDAINSQGGTIKATNSDTWAGACFVVTLPKANDDSATVKKKLTKFHVQHE